MKTTILVPCCYKSWMNTENFWTNSGILSVFDAIKTNCLFFVLAVAFKSREDHRKQMELEEARKAGLAPAELDEDGKEINPHIPQYMSSAPWYLNAERPVCCLSFLVSRIYGVLQRLDSETLFNFASC